MQRVLVFTWAIVYLSCTIVCATIINIPGDYGTIQEGIHASFDGDTILVQPGTYVENLEFRGHDIVLGSLFLTTGNTAYISQTVIDGDSLGPVVSFISGEDSTTVLTGFTIQNGSEGGILIENMSNPIIQHCVITENYSNQYGGGIACYQSSPTIINNTIIDNLALEGGGIACREDATPLITHNLIRLNTTFRTTVGGHGAGMSCVNSNPVIADNIFDQNFTTFIGGYGGGIYCISSNPMIINNLFYDNNCIFGGGAIYCSAAHPTLINNTITRNNSATYGGGISCRNGSRPTVVNCILWDDYAPNGAEYYAEGAAYPSFTYCNIEGGYPGAGCINIYPRFRNPVNDDFHLQDSIDCGDPYYSPCIDVGSPVILDSLLDCDNGLNTSRSDLGAYGGRWLTSPVRNQPTANIPSDFFLAQNFPNPFNATTVLKYNLPAPDHVTLTVHNILGQTVETLHNDIQQAGYHEIVWDASGFASGIYFAHLQSGHHNNIIKMLLLK